MPSADPEHPHTMDLQALQYPAGKFQRPEAYDANAVREQIQVIRTFPAELTAEATALSHLQLNTTYRPGGWTTRQVIHHCADSHMNSFIRFKLALTEDNPTIKPYQEDAWAVMPDYEEDIKYSLMIIQGVHARWTTLLEKMQPAEFERTVFHPEKGRRIPLFELLALYAWHCRHHLAHVRLVSR